MKRRRSPTMIGQYGQGPGHEFDNTAALCKARNECLPNTSYSTGIHMDTNAAYSGGLSLPQQETYDINSQMLARSPLSPLSPQQSSFGSNTQSLHHFEFRLSEASNQGCTSHYREPYLQNQASLYSEPSMMETPLQSSSLHRNLSSTYAHHDVSPIKSDDEPPSNTDSNVQCMLRQLERALLGPDDDIKDDNDGTELTPCVDHHDNLDFQHIRCRKEKGAAQFAELPDTRSQVLPSLSNQHHSKVHIFDTTWRTALAAKEKHIQSDQVSDTFKSAQSQTGADSHDDGNKGHAEQLLVACAAAMADENLREADILIGKLKGSVSIYGEPIERLAAYMVEGLIARRGSSGPTIYKSLRYMKPPGPELLSPMEVMCEVCPCLKFGCMAANGAIAEAFTGEKKVHIIDFQIAHGTQWMSLIQALANRPGGPPDVRITGINDWDIKDTPDRGLELVGQKLTKLAQSIGVPFEFNPLSIQISEMQPSMIEQRCGEALAVNFALQLHHMPDESVSTTNPRDRLLRMVKRMNPKVVTLVEQEANTNTTPFFSRFLECLDYYSAVFESIDVALPRDSRDRIAMEQHCLARDLVNIIACEGLDRVERHELMGKWRSRLMMTGFRPHPLSPFVNTTIRALLELYSKNYRLQEEDGALFLGWLNRPLIVASAWC